MSNKVIATRNPGTLPFSPAVRANGFIFLSGQLGIDKSTGALVNNSFEDQLRQTLTNVTALLHETGSDWSKVVKVGVFLQDLANYSQLNEIYAPFVKEWAPARTAVQVAGLPLGALVEIDLIALE